LKLFIADISSTASICRSGFILPSSAWRNRSRPTYAGQTPVSKPFLMILEDQNAGGIADGRHRAADPAGTLSLLIISAMCQA
jgi:hypothetical protein